MLVTASFLHGLLNKIVQDVDQLDAHREESASLTKALLL